MFHPKQPYDSEWTEPNSLTSAHTKLTGTAHHSRTHSLKKRYMRLQLTSYHNYLGRPTLTPYSAINMHAMLHTAMLPTTDHATNHPRV